MHLTLCLAKACAPNIIVNSIAPGLLETDWATVAFSAERLEELKSMAALKRHPTLEDCAELACTLLTTRSITVGCMTCCRQHSCAEVAVRRARLSRSLQDSGDLWLTKRWRKCLRHRHCLAMEGRRTQGHTVCLVSAINVLYSAL